MSDKYIPLNLYLDLSIKDLVDMLTGNAKCSEWSLYERIYESDNAIQRAYERVEDDFPEIAEQIDEIADNLNIAFVDDFYNNIFKSSIEYKAEDMKIDGDEDFDSDKITLVIPARINMEKLSTELNKQQKLYQSRREKTFEQSM